MVKFSDPLNGKRGYLGMLIRNTIIHIKKEIPEYAEVIKNCNELKNGMLVNEEQLKRIGQMIDEQDGNVS